MIQFFLFYTRTDQKQSTQCGYLILKVKINPVVTPGELLSAVNVIARSEIYVHVNLVIGGSRGTLKCLHQSKSWFLTPLHAELKHINAR